jgi:glycosyltransferase involved in cell wall biosynthesis
VIVVDDGSTDDTREVVLQYPEKLKYIYQENRGRSAARNRGIDMAEGKYVAFLDSDDSWAPRKLELQMAALLADPSIALIAHRMIKRPRGTSFPRMRGPVRTQVVGRAEVLFHNPFPTASVILRRDLPFRFDPHFWHSEDYLLWSRIVFSGHRCAKINQVLAIWNERENGAVGLSDDVMAIHRARRKLRRKLMREGLISRPEYVFARTIGVLSRMRRNLVLGLRDRKPYRPNPALKRPSVSTPHLRHRAQRGPVIRGRQSQR